MSDPEGGVPRRPQLRLDHILVPVLDLEAAARRYESEYGLAALAGGRHPRVGTANMIIPLGDTYIELIAAVDEDEARQFPRSRRVLEAAQQGRPFVTWAARTDDLDGFRAALVAAGWDLPDVNEGARVTPAGTHLRWRSQELVQDAAPTVLPFVIEWQVADADYPGRAPAGHRGEFGNVVGVHFRDPDPAAATAQLRALVNGELDLSVEAGDRPELIGVDVESGSGRLKLR